MMDHLKIRLLLISEEEADAVLIRERLKEIPYTSIAWTRTAEAGAFALAHGEHDLCLLDFELGERNDFELLDQHGDETPTIVLVRPENLADRQEPLPAKAFDFIDRAQIQEAVFERTIRYALERRSAIVALQRSDARFRALIEQTPEALIVHDCGRILYVNARTLRELGADQPADLVGASLLDLVPKEDQPALQARFLAEIELRSLTRPSQRDPAPLPVVYRFVHTCGSMVPAEVVEIPVVWDGGPAVALLGRNPGEHLDTQARLLLADRFAQVSSLAASVAHEINNPLAYVTSNLVFATDELARLAGPGRNDGDFVARMKQVREALADARQGAERVEAIARDLKIFSQARDDRRSSTDILRVLELALNMAKNEIRGRARLVTEFAPVPEVVANDGRLAQVFINLLLNAAQAIPEGKARENTVRVATRADRDRVIIEISDTGIGMSSKVSERVFDPFFTTRAQRLGTGLGLFVCQQIVDNLGGRITVESELGRGSTFRVELPAHTSAMMPVARPHAARAHILIVDDEPLVCSSLQRSLKRDYEVTAVQSARSALELITQGVPFDLVLCDLMMPEMSGMDLYDELSRSFPSHCAKLIFFTGGASSVGAREFLERVPNPRLEKPADIARIRELVRERIAS